MKKTLNNALNLKEDSMRVRRELITHYYNKYFSLWFDNYEWEGVTDEQIRFIMKELWNKGTIACFPLAGSSGSTLYPEGCPVFVPYAPSQWNIYYAPIKANLINLRAVTYIPPEPQEVNKDCVLGWAHRSHLPVLTLIKPLVDKLIEAQMVLRTNLKAQKMPFLVAVTPETESKMRELVNCLEQDDPALFVQLSEADKAQSLVSGAPYIIDKLYNYCQAIEGEIRELMGIENLGTGEKKEHLISAEIGANDEITESSSDCFFDELEAFVKRVNEYLGITSLKIRKKEHREMVEEYEENEEVKEDVA